MIKKAISCFFLLVFVFNLIGYRILVYYAQQQTDNLLENQFDNDIYDKNEDFTISVPLNLPYATNWENFERFDGEVSYKGKIYKYIKRKVYNNQLLLVCLPNVNKMRLENVKNNFFEKTVVGQNTNDKKTGDNKTSNVKKLATDYYNFTTCCSSGRWHTILSLKFFKHTPKLYLTFIAKPTQPPQIG